MGRVISTCIQFIDAFSNPAKKTIDSMRNMAREAKAAGKSIQRAGNTIQSAGKSLVKTVTAPIAGVGIAAVKTAADYESAMSNVKAVTGATGDEFEELEKMGLDLGASTAWSAKECADAMKYTGMAGWKAEETVSGLKGILDLASASGTDLARTSDIMTDAISAFGDKAIDSAKYADTMTKAITSGNVSVDTLGESYKYCGAICGTMKYSVEEITASLTVMGDQGIKGSQAGTALKNAISNMAAPTNHMKAAMDDLNISITNQDGSMKSWGEVVKNLQSSFGGLTEKQQAAYAKQIFGKESMAGMLAIINTSTKEYNELSDAIKNSGGAADETAKGMLANLNGQLTRLKGALEGAAITIGKKLSPYVATAVGWVRKATDWFNRLSDAQVTSIMKWAGIAAAIGPCILVFGKVVTGVGKVVSTFGKISGAIVNAGSIMGLLASPAGVVIGVLAAIAVAAVLVVKNWDKIRPVIMNVKEWFVGTFGGTIKQAVTGFRTVFVAAMDGIKSIMPGVGQFVKSTLQAAVPVIRTIVSALAGALPKAIGIAKTVIKAVAPIIQTIFDTLGQMLPKVIGTVKTVVKSVAPVIQTLVGIISKAAPVIGNVFTSVFQKLGPVIKTVGDTIKAAIPIVGSLLSKAFAFVGNTIAKVMPAINTIVKTIGGALVFAIRKASPVVTKLAGVFSAVFTKVFGIVSSIVRKLRPAFGVIGTIVKSVMKVVQGTMVNAFSRVASTISTVVGGIKAVFGGLMDVLSGVIDFISGVFTGNWSKAWEGVKGIFKGVCDALVGILKTPVNGVIGIINSAISGLNSISVDIPDWVPLVGGTHFGLNIPTIPALARGTENWKGGIAQISEKGGEIVDLPRGARVYPHDQSIQMARKSAKGQLAEADRRIARLEKSGGGRKAKGNVIITIPKLADQIFVRDEQDVDRLADEMATKLKDTARNMGVA